jgi:predicted transglutaminase-like protease
VSVITKIHYAYRKGKINLSDELMREFITQTLGKRRVGVNSDNYFKNAFFTNGNTLFWSTNNIVFVLILVRS